ncbi:MAG: hypothetical protein ACRC6G_06335, partial [Deefgea sp.]
MSVLNARTKLLTLLSAWDAYRSAPNMEHFVEFALGVNTLAELLRSGPSLGLARVSYDLEQDALALFNSPQSHPISVEAQSRLQAQIEDLSQLLSADLVVSQPERRHDQAAESYLSAGASIALVSDQPAVWRDLMTQLGYFGLDAR